MPEIFFSICILLLANDAFLIYLKGTRTSSQISHQFFVSVNLHCNNCHHFSWRKTKCNLLFTITEEVLRKRGWRPSKPDYGLLGMDIEIIFGGRVIISITFLSNDRDCRNGSWKIGTAGLQVICFQKKTFFVCTSYHLPTFLGTRLGT